MTEEELKKMLGGDELLQTLDIKTLVLDMVRKMDQEEIMEIFWSKLPNITEDQLKDYYYMRRG